MSVDIKVRKAKTADIETMVGLLADLFSVEADFIADGKRQQQGLEMMLEDEDKRCILVAQFQNKVIGMCSAQILISTSEGGPKALVEDVVVSQEYRGRGVATMLLLSLGEWAEGRGASRLDLMADRHNAGGLEFYNKLKWNQTDLIVLQKRI